MENQSLRQRYLLTSVCTTAAMPASFNLYQNYPNPFNPTTTIAFSLANDAEVKLEIFNILGQQVATVFAGKLRSGPHEFQWHAANLPGGIYYAVLKTETERQIIKILLLK